MTCPHVTSGCFGRCRRIARALGADEAVRHKRLLLLDTDQLTTAEDLANLLVSPKGWLCPLEHKICQFTCV